MSGEPNVSEGYAPLPYKLRRNQEKQAWDVVDRSTDAVVGVVFRYIGAWWANTAGDIRNQHGKREWAAEAAWKAHTAQESDR